MKKRPVWVDYTMIIVGAFIMGFAIKNMYDPVNLEQEAFPAWHLL